MLIIKYQEQLQQSAGRVVDHAGLNVHTHTNTCIITVKLQMYMFDQELKQLNLLRIKFVMEPRPSFANLIKRFVV